MRLPNAARHAKPIADKPPARPRVSDPASLQSPAIWMPYVDAIGRWSRPIVLGIGYGLIVAMGVFDYLTGYEISFAVFYLLPVAFIAWFAGGIAGAVASVASAATWQIANHLAGERFSNPAIPYWNAAVRLTFFLTVTTLLTRMRAALAGERLLARTDHVTGVANARAFYEMAGQELARSRRYGRAFTMAYLDIDNFKAINDEFGHTTGDAVLSAVASAIRQDLRAADSVARLGGDEFAVLLPETVGPAADLVLRKMLERIHTEAARSGWQITCSIGALACLAAPESVDDLIRFADHAMYAAKNRGGNALRSETFLPCADPAPVRF